MTSAAVDASPAADPVPAPAASGPASMVLLAAILLVATLPSVAAGGAALGTWLARIGFCLAGAGGP